MTFVDWSDSESMFGLLLDFVADERAECPEDPERRRFLSELLAQLGTVDVELLSASPAVATQSLRDAYESVAPEFASDPVMVHVKDCIEELERVENEVT